MTVTLFQKHVNVLRKSNVALQEKCNNLEHLVECNEQYSRRSCLRITNVPCEKDKTSVKVLEKVKKLVNEAGVDLEHLVECNEQYSRRSCLRITNVPCEKDKTSVKVLEKVKKLVNEAGVDIPDSNIDRAHLIGPKNNPLHLDITLCYLEPEEN